MSKKAAKKPRKRRKLEVVSLYERRKKNCDDGNGSGINFDKLEELRGILHEYSDLYEDDPSDVENVLKAYRLEKWLSGVEVYGKPRERVLAFIEELQETFFVSTFTGLWKKSKKYFDGEIFVSRFRNLVLVAKDYGLTDECADLAGILYGSFSIAEVAGYCSKPKNRLAFGLFKGTEMSKKTTKKVKRSVSFDKLEALKEILQEYSADFDIANAMKDVSRAYKLEKSLSSIEVYRESKSRVLEFIEELREFFFVSKPPNPRDNEKEFSGIIYVSRFRGPVPVAEEYKLSDKCADLAGILLGYPTPEVAKYCLMLENRPESPIFGLFK